MPRKTLPNASDPSAATAQSMQVQDEIKTLTKEVEKHLEENVGLKNEIQELEDLVAKYKSQNPEQPTQVAGTQVYNAELLANCVGLLRDRITNGPITNEKQMVRHTNEFVRQAKVLYDALMDQTQPSTSEPSNE